MSEDGWGRVGTFLRFLGRGEAEVPFEAGYYLTAFLPSRVLLLFTGVLEARLGLLSFFNTSFFGVDTPLVAWILFYFNFGLGFGCLTELYVFLSLHLVLVASPRYTLFLISYSGGRLWLYTGRGCLDGCLVMSFLHEGIGARMF